VETGHIRLDDLAPRIRELRSRQEQLLSRRIELEALMSDRKVDLADLSTVKDYVDDLRQTLDESPLSERRAFIRSFVEDIVVTKKEVQLSYTAPLLPKGLSKEEMGVLPIVRYGGR
jgi:site-specific DNA recombinase